MPEHDLIEAEEDEQATEAENLVLRYLQEAGRVPLLTPADEVDLAQQIEAAKARVVAVLQGHMPVESPRAGVGGSAPGGVRRVGGRPATPGTALGRAPGAWR